jgi:hypothetical protein
MRRQYADDDIIIRIPRRLYSREVQNMLSMIEHKKIVSKSKATEKKIEKFLDEVKKDRGKMMKAFLKKRGIATK